MECEICYGEIDGIGLEWGMCKSCRDLVTSIETREKVSEFKELASELMSFFTSLKYYSENGKVESFLKGMNGSVDSFFVKWVRLKRIKKILQPLVNTEFDELKALYDLINPHVARYRFPKLLSELTIKEDKEIKDYSIDMGRENFVASGQVWRSSYQQDQLCQWGFCYEVLKTSECITVNVYYFNEDGSKISIPRMKKDPTAQELNNLFNNSQWFEIGTTKWLKKMH